MGIRALRILQQLGHEVIFFNRRLHGAVGDPDKDTGRKMLTEKDIEENMPAGKNKRRS